MILSTIQADTSSLTIAGVAALLTALVAVPAALLYLLGLLSLGVPIYRITKDFSTALYAIALMQKTVVAGQGIKAFAGYPLLVNVLLIGAYIVSPVAVSLFIPLARRVFGVESYWLAILLSFFAILVITLIITVFAFVLSRRAVDAILNLSRLIRNAFTTMSFFRLALFFLTIAIVLLILMEGGILLLPPEFESSLFVSSGWAIVAALSVSFIGAFIMSVPAAITRKLRLPKVRITGTEKCTVGSLIDHSGGCWHLLDEDGTIRAIPDGQVKVAHIMRGDTHDFDETSN